MTHHTKSSKRQSRSKTGQMKRKAEREMEKSQEQERTEESW